MLPVNINTTDSSQAGILLLAWQGTLKSLPWLAAEVAAVILREEGGLADLGPQLSP